MVRREGQPSPSSFNMPPQRSRKLKDRDSCSVSHKARLSSADYIDCEGDEMLPCSGCVKYGRSCVVLGEKSQRCGECVRRGISSCDVRGIPLGNWSALCKEEARLRGEHEAAFAVAMEAMARADRLKRMAQRLAERRSEMMSRNISSLDELDAAEEQERREEAGRAATVAVPGRGDAPPLEAPPAQAALDDPSFAAVLAAYDAAYDPSDPYWNCFDSGVFGGSGVVGDTGGGGQGSSGS